MQRQINELSQNKLSRLLYRARIAKLEEQKQALFEKYGSWEEIGQRIIELNTSKHEKQFKYSQNLAILEKLSPRNPKEMLEKYYEQKLVEFQEKQKLELINSQPVRIKEVVKEYNIFLMHGINEVVGNATTALYNKNFEIRLMTNMLNPAVSSFSYGEGIKSWETWSDCGVVFGKNTDIYWASPSDLSTISRGFRKRAPINPTHYKTIRDEIHSAIADRSPNHNEFVVIGEPVGFWIAVTSQFQQWESKSTMRYIRETEPKILAAQKLGLSIFILMDEKLYRTDYTPVDEIIAKKRLEQKLPELETIRDYKACFILGKEVKPQDIMTMKSPITREKQIEIAKELTEKGIFSKDQLPSEFF